MKIQLMKLAAAAFLALSVFVDFSSHLMSILSDGLLVGAALMMLREINKAS